ncbi:hypothetical protein [Rothia sp. L_38]|uniref:hypothetical protein n=1 Tax=Rothia sp. L_38 TaxID=3422315 RepID=UPI003D6C41AB
MNVTPTAFPGAENLTTVIGWIMYGGMMCLLAFFIIGIVKAAQSRRQHAEERVEAPTWPLVGAALMGMAGTIFNFFM